MYQGFGQPYDPLWAMKCMAHGGIPIPATQGCKPKVYEPPSGYPKPSVPDPYPHLPPYQPPEGNWIQQQFCAAQGKVWSKFGCVPGPTAPPPPVAHSCPGNEMYDPTIGACMCPPGTEWTGTVGDCSPQLAQKFVGEGSAPAGVDVRRYAAQACAAMGGQWSDASLSCNVSGQEFQLPDFQPDSLPTQECPADQVQTPQGCRPYPGGVVDGGPPVGPPPPGPTPVAQAETPAWVVPVVIGVGAIAIIALVK